MRLQCPKCGNRDEFRCEATIVVRISDSAPDNLMEPVIECLASALPHVNFDSFTSCDNEECEFTGQLEDFQAKEGPHHAADSSLD